MPFNVTNFSISSTSQILNSTTPIVESTSTVGAGSTSITLNLAHGPYRDLNFLLTVRSVNLGATNLLMRLNGDATAKYDFQNYSGTGAPNYQVGQTSIEIMLGVAANDHASILGRISSDDYANTPIDVSWTGSSGKGATFFDYYGNAVYDNAGAAISSLTFLCSNQFSAQAKLMAWGVQ